MTKTVSRKCVVCGEVKEKPELIRVVRMKEAGDVRYEIDESGRMNGRGAYLCRSGACRSALLKKRSLDRSFHERVPMEVYERLSG